MLDVNPGLIVWTIVTFVCLLIVLRKFAWKPLLEVLQKREEHVRSSIERAEHAKQEAERLLKENQEKLSHSIKPWAMFLLLPGTNRHTS